MTPARDRFADGGLAGVGASLLALASRRSASAYGIMSAAAVIF